MDQRMWRTTEHSRWRPNTVRFETIPNNRSHKSFRHYSVLVKRLKSGMKHDETLEDKVTALKWKRVFPVSTVNEETGKKNHHKHEQFWEDLGIDA